MSVLIVKRRAGAQRTIIGRPTTEKSVLSLKTLFWRRSEDLRRKGKKGEEKGRKGKKGEKGEERGKKVKI